MAYLKTLPPETLSASQKAELARDKALTTTEYRGTEIRHKTAGTEGQIVGSYVAGDTGGFRVYVPAEKRSFALPFKDLDNWERSGGIGVIGPDWQLEQDYMDGKISKEKYEKDRLKREAAEMRIKANDAYARGQIDGKTWRARLNKADKISAAEPHEVLRDLETRSYKEGKPLDGTNYNGYANWDTWETKLILDNTEETQKWQNAWGKNWHQKMKAGKFDPEKAELVVSKYLVPVARGKRKWAGCNMGGRSGSRD